MFRHEVPVSSQRIDIVHMDSDIVVVDKPASIPVRIYNFKIFLITLSWGLINQSFFYENNTNW